MGNDSDLDLTELVRSIRSAHAAGTLLSPPEGRLSLADAYDVQRRVVGEQLAGYKLGLVHGAAQRSMGVDEPVFGRIRPQDDWSQAERMISRATSAAEPELAVRVGATISADLSLEEIGVRAGPVVLAVEFLTGIWSAPVGAALTVAGNASLAGVVLGRVPVDVRRDGELRISHAGHSSAGPIALLGDHRERLRWLAERVGPLPRGTIVMLGAPCASIPIAGGDLVIDGPAASLVVSTT